MPRKFNQDALTDSTGLNEPHHGKPIEKMQKETNPAFDFESPPSPPASGNNEEEDVVGDDSDISDIVDTDDDGDDCDSGIVALNNPSVMACGEEDNSATSNNEDHELKEVEALEEKHNIESDNEKSEEIKTSITSSTETPSSTSSSSSASSLGPLASTNLSSSCRRTSGRSRKPLIKFHDENLEWDAEVRFVMKMTDPNTFKVPVPDDKKKHDETLQFGDKIREIDGVLTIQKPQCASHSLGPAEKEFGLKAIDKSKKRVQKPSRASKKEKLPKEKKPRKKKDKNAPKRAKSAYNCFNAEKRDMFRKSNEGITFPELSRMVGKAWATMNQGDKQKYEELAAADKIRYQQDMELYKDCLAEMQEDEEADEEADNNSNDSVDQLSLKTKNSTTLKGSKLEADDADSSDEVFEMSTVLSPSSCSKSGQSLSKDMIISSDLMTDDDDDNNDFDSDGDNIKAKGGITGETGNNSPKNTMTASTKNTDKKHPMTPIPNEEIVKKVTFDEKAKTLPKKGKRKNTLITGLDCVRNVSKPTSTSQQNDIKTPKSKHSGFSVPMSTTSIIKGNKPNKKKQKFLPPVKAN